MRTIVWTILQGTRSARHVTLLLKLSRSRSDRPKSVSVSVAVVVAVVVVEEEDIAGKRVVGIE